MSAPTLSEHLEHDSVAEFIKVRCDRNYALFLKHHYRDKFLVDWQNGIMTVTKPMIDLTFICEE